MKMLKLLFLVILKSIDISGDCQAQQLFTPFSFSSTQGNLRLSLSQGEAFVGQLTGDTFIATMGFHQGRPDLMSSVTVVGEEFSFTTTPNPTQSFIIFQSEHTFRQVLMYNAEGKLVIHQDTGVANRYELQLNLMPGLYFCRVIFNNGHSAFEKLIII